MKKITPTIRSISKPFLIKSKPFGFQLLSSPLHMLMFVHIFYPCPKRHSPFSTLSTVTRIKDPRHHARIGTAVGRNQRAQRLRTMLKKKGRGSVPLGNPDGTCYPKFIVSHQSPRKYLHMFFWYIKDYR